MSLSSSQIIRKTPWTCLSCSTLVRTSQALIAGSANQSQTGVHQRKHSSSKTPSPPKHDSRAITAPAGDPAKEGKSAPKDSTEKRPGTRVGRGKSKDGLQDASERPGNELALNLPSVPSTKNVHPSDIHMSSFFSIHRPISLTAPIPHQSSNKTFSSIFDARPPSRPKTAEVIYTLSSAVDTLENAASTPQGHNGQQMSSEEADLRQVVTQASSSHSDQTTHHVDLPAKALHINLQELAKKFRPFVPPPAPVPLNSSTEGSQTPEQQSHPEAQPAPTQKSYTTTLTIHETSYPNGQKIYKTHATPIIEESDPQSSKNNFKYLPRMPRNQPFLGRMRQRQLEYLDRIGERDGWIAISVKRQRKLKMKKHKYKKLMKKTKNLRRRLGQT